MVGELKNYQSQVRAYQFEIERLDKEMGGMKQMYFQHRKQQKMGMIPEEGDQEQQYVEQDPAMMQQQQQIMYYNQQQQQYLQQ